MIPAGAHPVLLRSTLLERIDAAIEGGGAVHLVAIRTRPCWYEVEALHRWLRSLPPDAVAGMLSEQALVVMSGEPLAGADRGADVAVGHAELRATGARTADELVTIALSPTLAPGARPRAAAVPAGPAPASPATRAMREEAAKIAPSAVSVLLTGETGVGKEVLARFIHERSGRSGPLVSVNTAALPESLVESELFGHERGAFSGALQAKVGLVEAAHGGTLFLDEIGDLPLALQAKLLRVLEERAVRRLGATVERKVDVRVIAATHRDLERAVAEGTFRRDLLFRVNAATLVIPPLRERAVEIEPLALELLRDLAERATPPRRPWGLSAEATALLRAYPWPGNIRELRNVVERGAALAPEAAALLPEHLPEHVRSPRARPASDAPRGPADGPPPPSGDVRGALADYERRRILDALDQVQGNQSQAAKLLGLPRRTLAYKMARLGIRVSG
jgi:transcriptional regulator with PAS, ATPase and Fis domain